MANLELEVWIDIGFINKERVKVGYLKHDRGNIDLIMIMLGSLTHNVLILIQICL